MRADASIRSLLAFVLAWSLFPSPSSAQSGDAPSPASAALPYVVGGGLENVQLSPDGERIAGMVRTASGLRALVSQKLDGTDQVVAYRLDKPGMDLELLRWLGNDRVLLRLSNNQELVMGRLPLPISRLVVIGLDGSNPKVLNKPSSLGWSNHMSREVTPACPGSQMVLLPSADAEHGVGAIGRFDAQALRWLSPTGAPDKALHLFSDAQNEVRLVVRAEGKSGTRMERLVRTDESVLRRFRPWAPKALDGVHEVHDLGISGDGKHAYLLVQVPTGAEVWKLSTLQDDAAPESLAQLDRMPVRFSVLKHGLRCEPIGLNVDGRTRTWSDGLDRLIGGIQAALPDTSVELMAWQGDRYLARVGGASRPTEYLAGIRSAQSLARVGSTHPNLETALPLQQFKLSLPGVLGPVTVMRSNSGTGPRPSLLCIDCRMHLNDSQGSFKGLEAYWATSGWAVVTSTPPSIPGEDTFRRTEDYLQHWQRVLDGLVAQGVTQKGQVVIVAMGSEAGRLALLLGQGEEARVQGVATLGALTDVPLYAEVANDADLGAGYRTSLNRFFRGLNRQALEERSPIHRAKAQRAQVLLMHADHDGVIDAKHATAMHAALQGLQRPSTLLILKDSTGQVDHPPYRLEVMQAIDRLLAAVRQLADPQSASAR